MAKITYTDKDKDGSAPVNQWRDIDANEVKTSVNAAYDELGNKLESSDIANFETATQLNQRDTDNRNVDNHTDGTTNKVFTAGEQTKLETNVVERSEFNPVPFTGFPSAGSVEDGQVILVRP